MNQSAIEKDLMIVNMGPHHPSMHGAPRLIVTLDGEDVVDCEPILGYLHRGMEKITENQTIIQYLPYVMQQLGNIQVPKKAIYIRLIMLELNRIAYHLLRLGPFTADIATSNMRMMHNYFRIEGVAADLPYGWIDECLDFCDYFLTGIVEYQKLIMRNPIFLE
ncbi:hypothetical protein V6Z12_D01G166300 [Gossypium hirsutum]